MYINDIVGKCNRLDKCGYHYTPRQYYEDNPRLRDRECSFVQYHRENEQVNTEHPRQVIGLPEWLMMRTMQRGHTNAYLRWLERRFGHDDMAYICHCYRIGSINDRALFWQVDARGRVRTGKVMAYDESTGKRLKGAGTVDWMHAIMQREGALAEGWQLVQCLYGEELLELFPDRVVAIAEGAKTAHIGAITLRQMVWVAVDSMLSLTSELLAPLKGRRVVLFPDQGRGFEEWQRRIVPIAAEVGFSYELSDFVERYGKDGGDIADIISNFWP